MKILAAKGLILCALLCPWGAGGVEVLEVRMNRVSGPGWQASGVWAQVHPLSGNRLRAGVEIDNVSFTGSPHLLTQVAIHCPLLEIDGDSVACANATVAGLFPFIERQRVTAKLQYGRQTGRLGFELTDLVAAGGRLAASGLLSRSGWELSVTATHLDAEALSSMLAAFTRIEPAFQVSGELNGTFQLHGTKGALPSARGSVTLRSVSVSNAEGTFATEAFTGELWGRMERDRDEWSLALDLGAKGGQLYMEPVFIDVGSHPFTLGMKGAWEPGSKLLTLNSYEYVQPGVGAARGSLVIALEGEWRIRDAVTTVSEAALPDAYTIYLAPFLFGTPLDALQTAGSFDADAVIEDFELRQLDVTPTDVHLDDDNKRFAIYKLNGELRWAADQAQDGREAAESDLSWGGGFLYGLSVGAGRLGFLTYGKDFILRGPVRLPLLDGGLMVHELALANTGSPDMRMTFDAELEPIGLRELTAALNWPSFSGSLSGTLPRLSYQLGEVTLGGQLEAHVFGGKISVEDLRISEPFGEVPQLTADIVLQGLNLETVTETFSFGRITGLLDGEIRDLHMVDWSPAAFDARFGTPRDDKTRRRISQRAIENISSLAGQGATAALSSGFLRFFQDFAYREIGLSCRLENDVCFMSGLDPSDEHYYIVKGQGVPRIDVIGHARRVAWPVLIDRLASIRYEDAVIE